MVMMMTVVANEQFRNCLDESNVVEKQRPKKQMVITNFDSVAVTVGGR